MSKPSHESHESHQSPDTHGHGAAVVDHTHHPHVCAWQTFVGIYAALLFLTFVTVGVAEPVSGLHLGSMSMVVAMLVAALKASLVMTVFMHLKWDTAINNIAFLGSLIFLSLLFLFTLVDHSTRGEADPQAGTPAPYARQAKFVDD
ncbi:MAG: cytochrome C oxidase subunit IV family protein [Planctomycetes bacterium]|nr:cytochrome C oxidase subunit IV family protein [Planctomycetota bacterium]